MKLFFTLGMFTTINTITMQIAQGYFTPLEVTGLLIVLTCIELLFVIHSDLIEIDK